MPQIVSLVYQPSRSEYTPPYHYNRVPVESLMLVAGKGIEGDFKAGRNAKRHLNILSAETVEALRTDGFKTAPGELGEQIVIGGLDVDALVKGDVLRLGSEALIEVTMVRTPCEWFERIQDKPMAEAEGRLGVMAKVVKGGCIRVGDMAARLSAEEKKLSLPE